MRRIKEAVATAVVVGCFTFSVPAWATKVEQKEYQIEEITVTAQKKEENVQDVPASVSVLGDLQIENSGIDSLYDVHLYIPNFSSYQAGGTAGYYSIRGQSNLIYSSPGVGVYIDDVPTNITSWSRITDLYEVERIEVLKGPQGNLYGMNTSGGVVNIVTKKPGNTFRANAAAEYGDYALQSYKAQASGPIVSDKLYVGMAGKYTKRDSYIEEEGSDTHDEARLSCRSQLRWVPTEQTDILLTVANEDYLSDYGMWVQKDDDPFHIKNMGLDEKIDTSGAIYSATIKHQASWFDLTSITAVVDGEYESIAGKDYTSGGDNLKYSYFYEDSRKWLQEMRFASPDNGSSVQWLLGGFYLNGQEDTISQSFTNTGVAGAPTDTYKEYKTESEITTETLSLFGQADYTFLERLTLTLGIRYDHDKRETDFDGHNNGNVIADYTASEVWDAYSPKVILDYKINDSVMTYASAAKGYKAGGYSPHTGNSAEDAKFDPEYSWSYEAGLKTQWMDNKITANICGFYTVVDDIQVMYTDPITWNMSYRNAAEATLWGIEFETMLRPFAGFQITGSLGLLDSEFTEHQTEAYEGNHVPLSPEYQAGLSAEYMTLWGGFVRGEGAWYGKSYFGEDNKYSQDEYMIVNAQIGYEIDSFRINLYIKNAFDETYYTFLNARGGVEKCVLGEPRTFGIQATIRF